MPPEQTVIDVAAGGLLESGDGDNLRIAMIRRSRYDDWTLPKGHLDPGETIEQAALREVEEETGCIGEIIEIVEPVSYLVKGQPKIVVFFRMKLLEEHPLQPNDEVSEVRWMSPQDALTLATYDNDRSLIASAYRS